MKKPIWKDVYKRQFPDCVQWLFDSMKQGDERYPQFFQSHPMSFLEEEKRDGKQRMEQSWSHILRGLYQALMNDKKVCMEVFDEKFSPEQFIEIKMCIRDRRRRTVRLWRQRRIRTGRSRLDCGNGRRIKASAFDHLKDKRDYVKRRYDNENRHYPHIGFLYGNAGAF